MQIQIYRTNNNIFTIYFSIIDLVFVRYCFEISNNEILPKRPKQTNNACNNNIEVRE